MSEHKLNIHEGSAIFVEAKGVKYNDGKLRVLLHTRTEEGSIRLVKDSDNALKFSHVLVGVGTTEVQYDVSSLSPETGHIFIATWSTKSGKVNIYVDGKPVAKTEMQH